MQTLQDFNAMLKDYFQGPVADQINQRVWARKYFSKQKKGWAGRQMVIPVHTGRNTGVGFRGEQALLPVAGEQQYRDLLVGNRNSYGRFSVTGELMDTAVSSGPAAFAGVMKEEMTRLGDDVANNENESCIFGGAVKGYVNLRVNGPPRSLLAQVVGNVASFSAPFPWEYQGDTSYFDGTRAAALDPANPLTWIRVQLIPQDTYIPLNTGLPNENFFVIDFTPGVAPLGDTLWMVAGDDAVGGPAVPGLPLAAIAGDRPWALAINPVRAFDSAAAPLGQNPAIAPFGTFTEVPAEQPAGLFQNLSSDVHFGIDRSTTGAAGTAPILRSNVFTHDGAGNGSRTNAASGLSLDRLQAMFDNVLQVSGQDPDVLVMSALMRSRYTIQLTGVMGVGAAAQTSNLVVDASGGKVLQNQDSLAYGGVRMQYDRSMPVSTIGFLHTAPWLFAELKAGGFANSDGNILARAGIGAAGVDAWEGFWSHRYNMVCKRPNSQVILTGITAA